MAQIKNSPLEGLRGTLGDLVFRSFNGKTFVSVKPTKPRKKSDAQKRAQNRFRVAAALAQQKLEDPKTLAYYACQAIILKLPNAYTAALQDALRNMALLPVEQKGQLSQNE